MSEADKDIIEVSGYAYIKERDKFKDVIKRKNLVENYLSAFDLSVKVGIDYGNEKDVTASVIGFTNDKDQFIVLKSIDDTTPIGKMMIEELEKMRTRSVEQITDDKLKAECWEIVKDKLVDVFKLYNCKTVEEYNQSQYRDCKLTEEEFELLKRGAQS